MALQPRNDWEYKQSMVTSLATCRWVTAMHPALLRTILLGCACTISSLFLTVPQQEYSPVNWRHASEIMHGVDLLAAA